MSAQVFNAIVETLCWVAIAALGFLGGAMFQASRQDQRARRMRGALRVIADSQCELCPHCQAMAEYAREAGQ